MLLMTFISCILEILPVFLTVTIAFVAGTDGGLMATTYSES